MVRAVREAGNGGLVFDGAVLACPTLLADADAVGTEAMVGACRVGAVGFLAEATLEAPRARTFAAHAVTVSIAIGNLAFVVRQLTFLALPAGIAVTFAVCVVASLVAQHGADALVARVAAEARVALTVTADAVSVSVAAVGTVSHHFSGDRREERDLLIVTVVVVERYEPEAGLHEARNVAMDRGLVGGTRCPRIESAENLLEVVLRVCGQSVSPRVEANR